MVAVYVFKWEFKLKLNTCKTLSTQNRSALFFTLSAIKIPGHTGIPGNERVDSAARQATLLPRVNPLPPSAWDLFTFIKSHLLSHWNRTWLLQTSNKLHAVKLSPIYWKSSNRTSRREEMVLAHLRIDHSRLTHTHLISHLFPADCPKCSKENLTVDHLFSCPQTDHLRAKYSVPSNRSMALQDSADLVSRVLKTSFLLSSYLPLPSDLSIRVNSPSALLKRTRKKK